MPPQSDSIEVRLAVLENLLNAQDTRLTLQIGRILSDIESEKATRLRLHGDWEKELDKVHKRLTTMDERQSAMDGRINKGIGAIMALQIIVPLAIKLWHP